MKNSWLDVMKIVCGTTKGPPRHKVTWWWIDEVERAVKEKRDCLKAWEISLETADHDRYIAAKKKARRAVWKAKEKKRQKQQMT